MIAKTLGFELTPENLRKYSLRGTTKLEAYYHFLEGMELLEAAELEPDIRKALEALGRAVELDPAYALGHWGLGYAYERLYHSRQEDKDPAALDKMYWHFKEASRIDPNFAETNLGVGWYYFNKGDNALAFDSFRKALELHRDGYMVNRDTGAFLRSIGLYEPALRYLKRAHRLSPTDTEPLVQIAACWNLLGRSEKALKYTREALAIREGEPEALFMHINLLGLTGRLDEAESWLRAMERFDLRKTRIPFLQEVVKALREGRGKPYAFGDNLPGIAPPGTYLYLAFGMKEEALANIRRGIDDGFRLEGTYYYSFPSLAKNPWYKALRGDPRFEEILKGQKELYDKELKPLEKL
jgi:Tfp pilus assembly protein PilF